jgi:hypothetical protein
MTENLQEDPIDETTQNNNSPKHLNKGHVVGVIAGTLAAGALIAGCIIGTIGYRAAKHKE